VRFIVLLRVTVTIKLFVQFFDSASASDINLTLVFGRQRVERLDLIMTKSHRIVMN
jgi:hypothetical protein